MKYCKKESHVSVTLFFVIIISLHKPIVYDEQTYRLHWLNIWFAQHNSYISFLSFSPSDKLEKNKEKFFFISNIIRTFA